MTENIKLKPHWKVKNWNPIHANPELASTLIYLPAQKGYVTRQLACG